MQERKVRQLIVPVQETKNRFVTGMRAGFFLFYPCFRYMHFVGSPWDRGRGGGGDCLTSTYVKSLHQIGEKCATSLKSVGVGGYILGSHKNSLVTFFVLVVCLASKCDVEGLMIETSIKFNF